MKNMTNQKGCFARILLAEDNPANHDLAQLYLSDTGIELVTAPDGRKALDLFRHGSFQAIFMDLEMPVMDGLEAIRRIRFEEREKNLPRTPVLALSAHEDEQYRTRCMDAGADDYILKPIRRTTFQDALGKHMVRPAAMAARELVPEVFSGLMDRFVSQCVDDLDSMHSHLAQEDFHGVRSVAHKIAGAASGFGMKGLVELCDRIRKAAIEQDGSGTYREVKQARCYLDNVSIDFH